MAISTNIDSNGSIFARDETFWNNYLEKRPQAPASFFERIYNYHQENSGHFGSVHDIGAGNGPYSRKLRSKFAHVIVSDIVAENVKLAAERLGDDGFTYRTAKLEEADDIPTGSVDMVFITNIMHFVDQRAGMEAVTKQLRPGGTFVCAGFGPALFNDEKIQGVWNRISQQGGRLLLQRADNPQETINIMQRSSDAYNVAPLDEQIFLPGAKRIHMNMEKGGITGLLPPERYREVTEPDHNGTNDVVTFENDEGWSFRADLDGFKKHFNSFPHSSIDPDAFTGLWQEVEDLLRQGRKLDGCFPATLILATKC